MLERDLEEIFVFEENIGQQRCNAKWVLQELQSEEWRYIYKLERDLE
jgi:hypothetical protein